MAEHTQTRDPYLARPGYPQIERPHLFAITRRADEPEEAREIVRGVYVNNGPYAACIVAVIDYAHGQWAAYMGGVDHTIREEEAMRYVTACGIKLSKDDGTRFFPMLPAECWRL